MNDVDDYDNVICQINNLIEHKTKEQGTQVFVIFS